MQTTKQRQRRRAAKGRKRAALSAQQSIPYTVMHPDGVCRLPGWSSFLNYFDSSLPFQLSFINRRSHSRSRYRVNIPQGDDDFNSIREEYTGMLKNQIAKSNNGIERSKYITFGIPAEGIAEARPRLDRVEADVMGNFKRLGKIFRRPDWGQRTLSPRTALTSASPAHSGWAGIGEPCPTCRF